MSRFLINFSYDGSNFNGYQKQPNLRTVQDEIERVLTSINNNKYVEIYSSGRTDKGVSAIGQMAHFDLDLDISCYKLKGALNSYLPNDIYVNDIRQVKDDFHARYNVKSKIYEYKINMGNYDPITRNFVYQYCKKLNIEKIKESFKYLEGTHDFTSFVCAENKNENKIRTIYKITLTKKGDIIKITFKGDGFLKYQIRNMVGLLIKIGEEKEIPENIPNLFEKKDRKVLYKTSPACGLTLVKVNYR